MPQTLPDLPYDYNALEPHIDEQTMRIHHTKHHQTYVDRLNDAIKGTEWEDKPVDEIMKNFSSIPDDKKGPVRRRSWGGRWGTPLIPQNPRTAGPSTSTRGGTSSTGTRSATG